MRMLRARSSRILVVVVVVTLFAGVFAAMRKTPGKTTPPPLFSVTETPARAGAQLPATRPADGAAEQVTPTTQPVAAQAQPITVATTLPSAVLPITALPSANPLVDAQAKMEAGDLLEARSLLNQAIASGQLGDAELTTARGLISQINQQVLFSRKVFTGDPFVVTYTIRPGEVLQSIANSHATTWELICRINKIPDPRRVKAGASLKMIQGPVHAVVHKSTFTMDLYLGQPGGLDSMLITSLPVGLGADDSTPVGTWKVINKLKNPTYHSPRGQGIMAADDPENPLGEFWLGLEGLDGQAVGKASYGIHGTIEPDTIGKQASMGCIRLKSEDIALVFELLVAEKSRVMVVD